MSSWNKLILGISLEAWQKFGIPPGFSYFGEKTLKEILTKSEFKVRTKDLELDSSWLQIIPYDVVFDEGGRIFVYSRRPDHKEERLADLWSFGIGGHTEAEDFPENLDKLSGFYRSADRELKEELKFGKMICRTFLGFLKRERLPVEMVHLGAIFGVQISGFRGIGPELKEGNFRSLSDIFEIKDNLEGWSKELFPHLGEIQELL